MKSEYAALNDLVLSQGNNHSDVINAVQEAILKQYKKEYPKAPIDSSIIVDETSGAVHIFSEGKEITPPQFKPLAERTARQVLIDILNNSQTQLNKRPSDKSPSHETNFLKDHHIHLGGFFIQLIFWGYNLMYLLFITILSGGLIGESFRQSVFDDLKEIGNIKTLLLLLLVITPLGTLYYVLKNKVWKNTSQVAKIFFLLESPLVIILFMALSMEIPTYPMLFFTLNIIFIPFLLYNANSPLEKLSKNALYFSHTLNQTVLISAAYLSLLFSFFTPLILGEFIKNLFGSFINSLLYSGFSSIDLSDIIELFIVTTLTGIGMIAILCLILLPFIISYLIFRKFNQTFQAISTRHGFNQALSVSITLMSVYILILGIISYQPNRTKLLNRLADISSATDFETKQSIADGLFDKKSQIKEAIELSQNARNSYLFSKNDTGISRQYQRVFYFSEPLANLIQQSFLLIAYPFTYQGESNLNQNLFTQYQYLYGEHPYQSETREPAKSVMLSSRDITANTGNQNLFATIVIDDTFTNTTNTQQEVIYEFSLPNGSVATDLKLGPELEYQGQIAPRGAAQETYQAELQRQRDPALLEQIGPRQFRLRVFPIPGKNDRSTLNGKKQRVQFTYITPLTTQGYGLPVFSKELNLKTSDYTARLTLNGTTSSETNNYISASGLSVDLCQPNVSTLTSSSGLLEITTVANNQIDGFSCQDNQLELPNLQNKKLAILLDVSITPSKEQDTPKNILKNNLAEGFLSQNQVDLYLFNDQVSQPIPLSTLDNNSIPQGYFGQGSAVSALNQLKQGYDLAVVFTHNESDLSQIKTTSLHSTIPVYIIHPDNRIPAYSQRFTTDLIKTNGLVSDNLKEALNHYLVRQESASNTFSSTFWTITYQPKTNIIAEQNSLDISSETNALPLEPENSTLKTITTSANNPFSFQASQGQLIKQIQDTNVITTAFKDQAHTYAQSANILTPFSSMIALVNQTQQNRLEANSRSYDRYDEQPIITNTPRNTRALTSISGPSFGFFGTDMQSIQLPSATGESSSGLSGGGITNSSGVAFNSTTLDSVSNRGVSSFSSLLLGGMIPLLFGLPLLIGIPIFIIKTLKESRQKK